MTAKTKIRSTKELEDIAKANSWEFRATTALGSSMRIGYVFTKDGVVFNFDRKGKGTAEARLLAVPGAKWPDHLLLGVKIEDEPFWDTLNTCVVLVRDDIAKIVGAEIRPSFMSREEIARAVLPKLTRDDVVRVIREKLVQCWDRRRRALDRAGDVRAEFEKLIARTGGLP